ncbi:MAG: hypothetical protein ACOC5L_02415 [Halobacteriota archaeon]
MIDELTQEGYKLIEDINYEEGLEKWDKAWEIIKSIVPSEVKSVEEAEEFMPVHLTQSIFNWCQDFEEKLFNMGLVDSTYFQKRREYCREFCQVFPESDSLIIQDMLRNKREIDASQLKLSEDPVFVEMR